MEFFGRNQDYVLFVYGLSFILLAVLCRALSREPGEKLNWSWLGLFGLYHGFAKWMQILALSLGDSDFFFGTRLALQLVAFLCLLEFGRGSLQRKGRPLLGPWLAPALMLLSVGLGWQGGLEGLNAAARYGLAFPGALLAMAALPPAAPPGQDPWKRRGLIFSAACLLAFGLTQWIPPEAGIRPALWLNEKTFRSVMGFPIQFWRTIAIASLMAGLWVYRQRLHPTASRPLSRSMPLLLVGLLALGWFSAEQRGLNRDVGMRDQLLEQATALAQAVNGDDVRQLAFAPEDALHPRFIRLQGQLKAVNRLLAAQAVFTVALRNGNLVYGPCAFTRNQPAPGDLYRPGLGEDTDRLFRGDPYVIGPFPEEDSRLVSARAPMRDQETGQILMTIGLNADPATWSAAVSRARLIPIAATMVLLLALLVGLDMIWSRNLVPPERQGVLRYLEAFLVLFCGAAISLLTALLIHESEQHRRHSVFARLAESRTSQIRGELLSIRTDMQSLSLFFQSSDFVSADEFNSFASPMLRNNAADAIAWAPRAKETLPHQGFPVAYVVPADSPGLRIGSDLAADPRLESVIRSAILTGLGTATPALSLSPRPELKPLTLTVFPFFPETGKSEDAPAGLVVALIRFENLLERAAAHTGLGENLVQVGLMDLTDEGRPRLIAVRGGRADETLDRLDLVNRLPLANLQPIFAFSRTYAVVSLPTPAFHAAYPLHGSLGTAGGGFLLSLVLALFVAFLRRRQWDLEREVDQRTAALRLSQENLAITLDSIGDGVIATDARGVVTQINPAAERLTGWPAIAAMGQPLHTVFRIVNSRTGEPASSPVEHVVSTGHVVGLANHTALVARDGTERHIADSAAPIRDASGAMTGVVLVFSDVTKEYQDRLRLEESELQFRLLAEHASDVIGRLSPEARHLYLSPSAARVLGYEPAALIGRSLLDTVHPDDTVNVMAAFRKGLLSDEGVSFELRFRRRDGTFRWMECSGRRVLDPASEKPTELILVSRDISERKKAEEERLEMERRLFHAQKLESLGVLTGGIAHDFNNLLTAMLGNLELARHGLPPADPARSGIEQAILAAKRAADLTRQMLAYSGKGLFVVRDLDLNLIVSESAGMLKAAISKTVTLNLDLYPDLPPVRADAGQVQQIVMNLLTNASEAIGEKPGLVTLSTGVEVFEKEQLAASRLPEKPAPGTFAWIEVSDTGCGMSADTMSRVFEPFFTTKFTGRGLGMSVVMGIMRGHGGAIFMDSRSDRGSVLRVLFPVHRKTTPPPAPPPPRAPRPAHSLTFSIPLPPRPSAGPCWWWTTSRSSAKSAPPPWPTAASAP